MVDETQVDQVAMVSRGVDGEPIQTPGFERVIDEDAAAEADAAQLAAIASAAEDQADEVADEAPDGPVETADAVDPGYEHRNPAKQRPRGRR